jgi:hypothetical protein
MVRSSSTIRIEISVRIIVPFEGRCSISHQGN